MKKKLLVLLTIMLAAILVVSVMAIPALAGPPEDASGEWCYTPISMAVDKVVGGNQFISSSDAGSWSGTFVGESEDYCDSVIHSSGSWWGRCSVSFASATVGDKTGGLDMNVLVSLPNGATEWDGKWVINGGSGDLKDLRGRGIMSGPGYNPAEPGECGKIDYSGDFHFKPD